MRGRGCGSVTIESKERSFLYSQMPAKERRGKCYNQLVEVRDERLGTWREYGGPWGMLTATYTCMKT